MKKTLPLAILLFNFVISGYSQNWQQNLKLESSDQQIDDNHAISVAKSGDYIIAGAWHHDLNGTGGDPLSNAGAAYIYHYDSSTETWYQEAKLLAADRELGDWFGISVDISGTYAVIGAVEKDAARGAAYVFERDGSGIWVQVAKLEATLRLPSDRFGNSVSISGNTIIVGAYHEDEDENDMNTMQNAGSAYIFKRENDVWSFTQKIVASDRDPIDYFGYSVAIWEDNLIVGAYHRDIPSLTEYGGAYAFTFNGSAWVETQILEGIDPYYGDRFGWSVDVYQNYYIVGAPYHDYDDVGGDPKNNAGAAYIFNSDTSWSQDKIVGGDRYDQDNAGHDVAIYGTRALLGAPLQNYGINGDPPYWADAGAVFVYEKDGSEMWNQVQKLLTEDRFTSDKFGNSVDLDDDTIIGGAPEDNGSAGPSTGALYVFTDSVLGTNNTTSANLFSVYPNPTTGQINVSLSNFSSEVNISIYNILGQVISEEFYSNTDEFQVNIDGPVGIYLINLANSNGATSTIKILKN
jgi:hypothetical protein